MTSIELKKLLLGTTLIAGFTAFVTTPSFAQDANDAEELVEIVEEDEDEADEDEVVVTGSRIKRDTFTSIAPLQVITTELSQDVGLFDPAAVLQRSEAAAGTQIDATFQGFVLDNGPGSQTLNLRGLGADRTLLLINGRRMAPAGVEGAPTNPSINLLPASLIERNELLLDGASSVYGSDAVAGVANIVLRKDFEGLELFASGNLNEQGAGDDYTVSASYGKNFDRGFVGVGAEYAYRDPIRLKDRDFLAGCNTHYEITSDGEIRTVDLASNANVNLETPGVSVSESPCKISGINGRIFNPFTRSGSIYYDPNGGNTPIPGFSESTNVFGQHLDTDGDGIRDVDFQNVNGNAANIDQVFITEQKLFNIMSYGEYTLEGEANLTPFFEVNYSRADVQADNTGDPQIFPSVPALNDFNPCNFVFNPTGVDCRAADNDLQGLTGTDFALSTGFLLPVIPIVTVEGDRNNVDTQVEQFRVVAGMKGDLPFMNTGSFNNWTFEVAGVHSRSVGSSFRSGIREDKLAFALGIDPTADFNFDGEIDFTGDNIADDYDSSADLFVGDPRGLGFFATPCDASELANPSFAMPDLLDGCVPVNLFAPSLLGSTIGDFATQAERDYLFGTRNYDTTYSQTMFQAFATGNVAEVPAGQIAMVVGAEIREDAIDSTPSVEASNGLFFGFFADQGAVGDKTIMEAFAELDIPVVADKKFFRELNLNVSGRITDEEFYGTAGTYSVKAGWRPVDSLLLKASIGTSFRAPNLRENFLLGQSGFSTIIDPCAVPEVAFVFDQNAGRNVYDPTRETRDPNILANCIREGRDPTTVGTNAQGINTFTATGVETTLVGSLDLEEETSKSKTFGFAFEQPFTDAFDFDLNVNYYDIEIEGAVIELSSQFIVNDCYGRDDGVRSAFCDRITPSPFDRQLISEVVGGFQNVNNEVVSGLDFNAFLSKEVFAFDRNIDLGLRVRANKLLERNRLFVSDEGDETFADFQGEFGFPEWTGNARFTADMDRFRFTWLARYIGDVEQDPAGIDPFDDAFGNEGTGFFGDTCLGTAAGDVTCRDVGFADSWMTHTASLRYSDELWTISAGVSNIFDNAPPLVDTNEVFGISNTPIGNGYDLDGREFFASIRRRF